LEAGRKRLTKSLVNLADFDAAPTNVGQIHVSE
jgi:hypothetical protein